MKYQVIADYESLDGFKSNGIVVDTKNSYEDARVEIATLREDLNNGYSNYDIYEMESNRMNKLEMVYQKLKDRQKQLDIQLDKYIDPLSISIESMLVLNAQSSEVQQILWIIEDLMNEVE
jgi:hypothetical protein